ncbi:MAG: aldo/keto reductase, partial [Jatrophihabitantaceae bacterium]|nr:aldo/keto reductase [Jatrophihabitantaceae bacterium]
MSPAAPTVRLLHGADIPQLGVGTSPLDDAATERMVAEAIGAGYRLIDTAENYGNEAGVGRGAKASGVAREDLFITSKFNAKWHGRDLVPQALDASLERLGLDYLDLLLIHWPNPANNRFVDAWLGLADLLASGRLKSIGVSNFKPAHLDLIIAESGVVPDINQIQLNPGFTRDSTRAYNSARGIATESWSPLGGSGAKVLDDPIVIGIADAIGRTPAQTVLRWHTQLGLIAVPKSSNPERLRQNLAIFDFELTPEQMESISALDQGEAKAY